MKRVLYLFSVFLLLASSCAQLPANKDGAAAVSETAENKSQVDSAAASEKEDTLASMEQLMLASRKAFDTNHPVEAMRHLVAILSLDEEAEQESDPDRLRKREDLCRQADTDLTELAARLVLEPGDSWIENGLQKSGSLQSLSRQEGLMPSVRLVINYEYGKAVVKDAPIQFVFTKGTGSLVSPVTTDEFGQASSIVHSVGKTDNALVIRAIPFISSRTLTRYFENSTLEFTYLPPQHSARVFAIERASDPAAVATAQRTGLIDAIDRGLVHTNLDIIPSDALLDPETFMDAFRGDAQAVQRALSLDGKTVSYIVLGELVYENPRQLIAQGRTYSIFTVEATAQIRIIRDDGSIVISRPALHVRGQGGTEAAAVQSALEEGRKAVEQDLLTAELALD